MKAEVITTSPPVQIEGNFREKVINLSNRFSWLPGGDRSLASIALLATLVAATIVLILWTSAKNYVPLYGNQEHYDKASILEILDKEKVAFRIDTDTGNIMVPQDRLADARITLAARGIKAAMPEGLSTIADKVTMGTSQFMESMHYQHALEGELARTIITMDGVRNSRVHLAVPKRNLFVGRQEEKSAASVMVDLAPGYELKAAQVEAIVSLISGSVPGLDPRKVSVVDQRGKLLTGELYDDAPIGKETDKKLAFIQKLERNIEQRAAIMLLPILGDENFRIQVSSDVDFSVVEETREAIDPNSVVRSEAIKTDTLQDQLAMGIPGALANQPPLPADQQAEDNNQRTSERNESSRQFDNGRAVTHTRFEVGRLKSMSVSVLVNQAAAADTGWSDEQLQQLGEMVKTATGFQAERGDQFNITSFAFVAPLSSETLQQGLPWWQLPEVKEYARYIFGTLIALALILFGVRPLVSHLVQGKKGRVSDDSVTDFSRVDNTEVPALNAKLSAQSSTQQMADNADISTSNALSGIPLPQLGSEFAEQITHMQMLASKESERVTAVIKYWVERGVSVESTKV
ncbi:MAG: flagellar M-ring protein FliF [Gammaproteobacteria bacterium]|nr:flagellar M-ring protein FliF [Gammaproteobacteria bacterium]MBU1553331.1 flagellar M-ring protein FliF [Gammaproteobacteria bacterium]MBU2070775.1 flagellar M-ring protein FliF [Gammaproteobacteria bacterium]MBU2182766.1 flagellar M-ring protein FliF [Gammaproteobacteria bacterium]MBU2205992.1 flagellar M-ring protein FliF [Gammaproteobacteria bacterium]